MNKILKRLLTGVLTLATVFTALPTTAVHAAETQYWTESEERVGIVEKVMNDGSIGSTFNEGHMTVEGEDAYCIDINTGFKNGYKTRSDASTRMTAYQIEDVALSLEYVKQYTKSHTGLSSQHAYLLRQLVVWQRLSVHLGWSCDNVRASYDEISKSVQDEVFAGAKAFVRENKGRYDCYGYIYTGEGQDLGQFFAELAVGNGKIQKSSSNTTVTNGNDCYSLSGATYGVYSDKGCTKSVATLTTNANGNTDTVELRAATYYVKETKAPKGFQLDKNVYTMTIKVNETTTLKVSDKPKVTDTLVELFKIDMEISKATPQGNASLEGAEFVWKYYDGYYTKDNLPSEPTRTWTTKTIAEKDSNNEVHYITRLADSYKVLGDSFYTQNGTICLPLGTITVEEKTAPNGYLLEGAYMQAAGSSEQIKGVYVAQITEDGELAALSGSNQYSVLDKGITGRLKEIACKKVDEQTEALVEMIGENQIDYRFFLGFKLLVNEEEISFKGMRKSAAMTFADFIYEVNHKLMGDFVSMSNDEINRFLKMEKLLESKISRRFQFRRLDKNDFGYLLEHIYGNTGVAYSDYSYDLPIKKLKRETLVKRYDLIRPTRCMIEENQRYLKIEREDQTTFVAYFTINNIVGELDFPSSEIFYYQQQQFTFPVSTSMNVEIVTNKKALTTVRNKKKELKDLDNHAWESNNETGSNVMDALDSVNELETNLDQSKESMYKLSYVIRVAADTLEELKRRCDEVKDFYDDLNVKLVRPFGDMLGLHGEFIPSSKRYINDYIQYVTSDFLAGLGFGATQQLGETDGIYIGYNLDTGKNVYLKPSLAAQGVKGSVTNALAAAFLGSLGGGKSFCNNLIIYYAVLFGGKAVIVDPKSGAKRSYLKRVGTALH